MAEAMKVKIGTNELVSQLKAIQRVAVPSAYYPYAGQTLITAADNKLIVAATDQATSITKTATANVESDGAIVVAAKQMLEVAKRLPGSIASLEVDGTWLKITSSQSQFKVIGLPAEEYPEVHEVGNVALQPIDTETLLTSLRKISASMCVNEARRFLNGGWFIVDTDNTISFISTDAHRLSYKTTTLSYKAEPMKVVVPKRAIDEMLRLFGSRPVEIYLDKNKVVVKDEETTLVTSPIDTQIPAYESIIPKSWTFRVCVERDDLTTSLRRVMVCADPKTHRVRFVFKPNEITLIGEDAEIGEAIETITASYEHEDKLVEMINDQKEATGEPADSLGIYYNGGYFVDTLKVIDTEKVWLEVTAVTAGMVVRPVDDDTQLHIIMPMAIT